MTPTVELLGSHISRLSLDEAVAACAQRAAAGEGGAVYFVNVHTLTEATRDAALARAFGEAALCVADGMPLVWLSRAVGSPIATRVYGPDFMRAFLARHADWVHGLLGGAPGRAEALQQRYGVRAVTYSPPMRPFSPAAVQEDWAAFVARCPDGQVPPLVWVGLGAPKQELWMAEATRLAPRTLFLGVGAAFDFLTGAKAEAPAWMQARGLAWAHRLATEPRRLLRRYAESNSRFLVLAARELLRGARR